MNSDVTAKTIQIWTDHEFWLNSKDNLDVNWTWILVERQRQRKFVCILNMTSGWKPKTNQIWTEHELWLNSKDNSDVNWICILAEQQRQFKSDNSKDILNVNWTTKTIQIWTEHEFWLNSKDNERHLFTIESNVCLQKSFYMKFL